MFFSRCLRGLAALALCIFPLVRGDYADPGSCSGNCWAHDPSLIRRSSDGAYFRFNTGGGAQIYKSDSLEGPWTYEGDAMPDGSSIDLDGNTYLWVRLFPRRDNP